MNWFLALWKRMQLLRTRDLSFKMEMETENIVSSTATDVNAFMAKQLPTLRGMRTRLAQLRTRLVETFHITDPWGNKEALQQPAFTADQVATLRSQRLGLLAVVLGFIIGEVALYYIISEKLVGDMPGAEVAALLLSLGFALTVLFAFATFLRVLFTWIDARELRKEERIPGRAYRKAVTDLVFASVVAVLCLGFLGYAGLARMDLIEGMGQHTQKMKQNNWEEDELLAMADAPAPVAAPMTSLLEDVARGNHNSGLMAFVWTFLMALLLGKLKRDLYLSKRQWAAYKAWQANLREQEGLVREIGKAEARIRAKLNEELECGVQLVHDIQRVYGQQFDPAHTALHKQYVAERSEPGFTVTRDVLNRYRPLIALDEQLFTAAVLEKASLCDLLKACVDETAPAASSLDTLYAGLLTAPAQQQAALPAGKSKPKPELNGQADLDEAVKQLLNEA